MTSTKRLEASLEGETIVARAAGSGEDAVICVHGLAAQNAAVLPLVEALAEHGYRALAPDLRGHGESSGHRGRISRERAVQDLRAWQHELEDEGSQLRAILGHSLGGFWAMAAGEELGADAIAAIATPASIRGELSTLELAAYRLGAAAQRLAEPLGVDLRAPYEVDLEEVLDTEEAIARAREIELIQRTLPLANVDDLLAVDGVELAKNVEIPTVVVHPAGDRLVERSSTRALYDALTGPRRWLEPEGPHECFFEQGGRARAREVVEEIEDVLAAP